VTGGGLLGVGLSAGEPSTHKAIEGGVLGGMVGGVNGATGGFWVGNKIGKSVKGVNTEIAAKAVK